MSSYRGGSGQVIARDEALGYIINCFIDVIPRIRRKIVCDWVDLEEITVASFWPQDRHAISESGVRLKYRRRHKSRFP